MREQPSGDVYLDIAKAVAGRIGAHGLDTRSGLSRGSGGAVVQGRSGADCGRLVQKYLFLPATVPAPFNKTSPRR